MTYLADYALTEGHQPSLPLTRLSLTTHDTTRLGHNIETSMPSASHAWTN